MKRIVVTGGTGFIGQQLVDKLKTNYSLTILTRFSQKYTNTDTITYVAWDGKSDISPLIDGVFAIINLAGENIGGRRWSGKQKSRILKSRTDAANVVYSSIMKTQHKPEVWIQASATGYYGNSSERIMNEDSPKGQFSFLADVCEQWELPAQQLNLEGVRTVIIRTGIVFSPDGGFLPQMSNTFRFGLAVIPGNGKQYLPWIHIQDEVRAIEFLLENNQAKGVYNLVSPQRFTMKEVISIISANRKPLLTIYIPAWILKCMLGREMAEELILANQQVIPKRLQKEGFRFSIDDLISLQ